METTTTQTKTSAAHAGYHDAENFENPARAEDQRNEVRLAFGVVWFRS
jgi:hypothetical protein